MSPRAEKLRLALGRVALILIPLSSLWMRLVAHPLHLRDAEFTMVPTAGREYAHGHLSELFAHQINFATHHGYLTDALLAAAGFTLLGDHYLAWEWVPLLYATVLVVAALSILWRTAGPPGAVAFCVLFTTGPFLMKDGVLAMVGAHAAGASLMLTSVALALACRSGRHFDLRAMAAGATVAAGFWYLPTVAIAALPVGALAARHGLRRVRDLAIGATVFVPLWCATVAVQMGERSGQEGETAASYSKLRWESLPYLERPAHVGELPPLDPNKLADVFCWTVANTLFAQPESLAGQRTQRQRGQRSLGRLWCLAWIAAIVSALVAVVRSLWREPRWTDPAWRTALIGLSLPLLYSMAYLMSPMGLEPSVAMARELAQAPPINGVRYLVPLMVLWTVLLSQQLGATYRDSARRWVRGIALGVGLVLALSGGVATVLDLAVDRDPNGTLGQLLPFSYNNLYSAGRGPTRTQHARCETSDGISRGNHLRIIGWYDRTPTEQLVSDPASDLHALDQTAAELGLDGPQRAFVAQGLGIALAASWRETEMDLLRLAGVAETAASHMGPLDRQAYQYGFAEAAFPDICKEASLRELIEALCPVAGADIGPLCAVAGRCGSIGVSPEAPPDVSGFFPSFEAMVRQLPPGTKAELARGVGWNVGGALPPSLLGDAPDGWTEEEWLAFSEGWRTGARFVWRWPDASYPAAPWFQP